MVLSLGQAKSYLEEGQDLREGATALGALAPRERREAPRRCERTRCRGSGLWHHGVVGMEDATSNRRVDGRESAGLSALNCSEPVQGRLGLGGLALMSRH